MRVEVEKITDVSLAREFCEFSMKHEKKSNISLEKLYTSKDSPLRTQLFIVRMYDIPYEVAVHLRTHAAVGQVWCTGSGRGDRDNPRGNMTDMVGLLNAQHLIEMAHLRLCFNALASTTSVMMDIKEGVRLVDEELYEHLVPQCVYLKRCDMLNSCGWWEGTDG